MKTFKLIGMALLAILVCTNFIACSSDDDPEKEDSPIVTKGKRVKSIVKEDIYTEYSPKEPTTILFHYDEQGRLTAVSEQHSKSTYITQYEWNEDNTILIKDIFEFEKREGKLTLNNSVVSSYEDNPRIILYSYDNRYLSATTDGGGNYTLVWDNNNIEKIDWNSYYNHIYGDYKLFYSSKIKYHSFMAILADYDNPIVETLGDETGIIYLYIAHPNLFGKTCKDGITKIESRRANINETHPYVTYIYTFEYNKDEYPTTIIETEGTEKKRYTITWE